VSRGTWDRTPGRGSSFAYGAITLYGWPFQTIRLPEPFVTPRGVRSLLQVRPATPDGQRLRALTPIRFGLVPFRSPLLRESRLISFPPPTEMFQFGGSRLRHKPDDRLSACRVSPFGHPRVISCLRLAGAFRSLPRPSSPAGAKASTVCP
jgi:hypothetical protein